MRTSGRHDRTRLSDEVGNQTNTTENTGMVSGRWVKLGEVSGWRESRIGQWEPARCDA
jgi:hypothetical protein